MLSTKNIHFSFTFPISNFLALFNLLLVLVCRQEECSLAQWRVQQRHGFKRNPSAVHLETSFVHTQFHPASLVLFLIWLNAMSA